MTRHAQTLDERGNFWRYGRWWWGPTHAEWIYKLQTSVGISLQVGSGDDQRGISWHLGTPLFSWFFTVEAPCWLRDRFFAYHWYDRPDSSVRPGGRSKLTDEREISLQWHSGMLWWMLWMDDSVWRHTDPRWRRGSFSPVDFLLGQAVYAPHVLKTERVLIPMPEKAYPATIEMREDSWKRPRWPWASYMKRADITPDEGIPEMGKGENSWDCGPDATYGLCCPARSVAEAVGAMVATVYRGRLRNGICAPDQAVRTSSERVS